MSATLNEEQFPIIPAIGFTLEKLWADRHALLSEARFPFASLLLVTMVGLALPYLGADEGQRSMWVVFSLIFALFVLAPICIRWSRCVILGEAVNEAGPPFPENTLAYVVTQIIIAVLTVAAAVVVMFPVTMLAVVLSGGQPSDQVLIALTPLIVVLAFGVTGRLNIALAAVAVDDGSTNIRKAWELTQGNGLRLAAGLLIILGTGILVSYLTGALFQPFLSPEGPLTVKALAAAASIAEGILLNLVMAGYFARAYLHFRGRSVSSEAEE